MGLTDWQAYKRKTLAQWASDSKNSAAIEAKTYAETNRTNARRVAGEQKRRTLAHSKWLLDPVCALDGSCDKDAPFYSKDENGSMEVRKEKDDIDFISAFYAEEAEQIESLNAIKRQANDIILDVRKQMINQDPGASVNGYPYLRYAMERDASIYDREYDGQLFPIGSDMEAIRWDRQQSKTLAQIADTALFLVPVYGEVVLAETIAEGGCGIEQATIKDNLHNQENGCYAEEQALNRTTVGGVD